jgi:CHASE2 domain-containing sensor protein
MGDRLRRFLRGCLFVAAGLLATHYLENHGWLGGVSRAVLDSLQRAQKSTPSSSLTIVTISDDDYLHVFENRSPLKQPELMGLIDEVLKYSPRIVGVDLDTEDWKQPLLPGMANPSLVWARLFKPSPSDARKIAELKGVVGNDKGFALGKQMCFGLTGMQADPDYVIREYQTEFAVEGQPVAYRSFPSLIRHMWKQTTCVPEIAPSREEERRLISFRGEEHEIPQITAGAVLDAGKQSNSPAQQMMKSLLEHKIVLIGGSYALGRDIYPTPVGLMTGVQILAHSIITEIQGPATEAHFSVLLIDLALGVGLVALGLLVPARFIWLELIASVILVPLLAIWFSNLLFHTIAFFLDFTPVLTSVFLHTLFEHLNEYLKLVRQHHGR